MKMLTKIATQTLVVFQIEINGQINQICGSHQLAPTGIIQRILSCTVGMALLTTKNEKLLQVKVAMGDHDPYGISFDKPYFWQGFPFCLKKQFTKKIISIANFTSKFEQKHSRN